MEAGPEKPAPIFMEVTFDGVTDLKTAGFRILLREIASFDPQGKGGYALSGRFVDFEYTSPNHIIALMPFGGYYMLILKDQKSYSSTAFLLKADPGKSASAFAFVNMNSIVPIQISFSNVALFYSANEQDTTIYDILPGMCTFPTGNSVETKARIILESKGIQKVTILPSSLDNPTYRLGLIAALNHWIPIAPGTAKLKSGNAEEAPFYVEKAPENNSKLAPFELPPISKKEQKGYAIGDVVFVYKNGEYHTLDILSQAIQKLEGNQWADLFEMQANVMDKLAQTYRILAIAARLRKK